MGVLAPTPRTPRFFRGGGGSSVLLLLPCGPWEYAGRHAHTLNPAHCVVRSCPSTRGITAPSRQEISEMPAQPISSVEDACVPHIYCANLVTRLDADILEATHRQEGGF